MYLHILFYFAAKRWNSRMRTNAMYSFIRLQKQNLFQSYADVTTFIFVCVTVQANNMMFSHIFYFFFFFWWRWGSDHCKHAHYAFCVTGLANVRNYIVSGHPCSRQCVGTPALCTAAIFFFRYSLFFFSISFFFCNYFILFFVCFISFWSGLDVLTYTAYQIRWDPIFLPHLRIIVNAVSNLVVSYFDQT